ncbi:MAG: HD domain-containing phosphohydrolase [Sedimenticola sp.]
MEFRIIDSSGRIRWAYEQGRGVNKMGHAVCLDGAIFEISEKRKTEEALTRSREELHDNLLQTIQALGALLDKRDPNTTGHQRRVMELAVAIGKELDVDADTIEGIRMGGSIHDIGKIYIPAEILNRLGRLNEDELEIVQSHSDVGYEVISKVNLL